MSDGLKLKKTYKPDSGKYKEIFKELQPLAVRTYRGPNGEHTLSVELRYPLKSTEQEK